MKWRRTLLSFTLLTGLAGCAAGGAGIGSLIAQGLQALGGDEPPSVATNSGPFRIPDNSKTMDAINDLASRTVSQACTTEAGSSPSSDATATISSHSEPQTHDVSVSSEAVDDPNVRCGYRPVCFPGNARPVRMLICRNDSVSPTVAQRSAE